MNSKQNRYDLSDGYKNDRERRSALALVYPIFAYFLVCQIVNMLVGLLPNAAQIDAVKRQGMGSLAAFLVLWFCFIHGETTASGEKKKVFFDFYTYF